MTERNYWFFVLFVLDKAVKSETKRKKTGGSQGCPYYKQDPIQDFREAALVDVRDIEQLVTLGKQMKACPYYGTRLAVPDAEVNALHPESHSYHQFLPGTDVKIVMI